MVDDAKRVKQPDHDADYHDDVKNLLDLAVHGDIGIHEPEQHAYYNKRYNDRYEWHKEGSLATQADNSACAAQG
jgi:hypothetical protein